MHSVTDPGHKERTFLVCMALVIITLTVYLQVGNHEFLSYDDDVYVRSNSHVASGITANNILWAFTSVDAANWHPVTWLSHMADAQLYGMNPRGHHLTNVVIHTVSSLLLLFLLLRVAGSPWQSSFVAALFALHPLHVESVAWVAERKDVLSGFFCFLTLLLYSEYASKQKPALYLLALFFFVLGLMSKPMLVTLPIIMFLMDYWPLNRCRREGQEQGLIQLIRQHPGLIKEKIPFFICSFFSGVMTIYAQHTGGATRSLEEIPLLIRLQNAPIAYVKYIVKTLLPYDLAVLYPMPSSFPMLQVIASLLLLLVISVACIRFGRRYPYLPIGWFWFLITLLPVIGFVQVGLQSMADRYSYISVIGLFIMAAWGVADLTKGLQHQKIILTLVAGMLIAASAAGTWCHLGYWRDSISLYRHTLSVTSDNSTIHYNLGQALDECGDIDAAIQEYQESIRIDPNAKKVHNNLGVALIKIGNVDAAIQEFQEALRIDPNDTYAYGNLGNALVQKKVRDEAKK